MNKTNFMLFHTFNKPIKENITLKINRIAIQEQKYIKYLGVLDSTLSWNVHLDNLIKKITRSIGIMYKIRPFVPKKYSNKTLLCFDLPTSFICNLKSMGFYF